MDQRHIVTEGIPRETGPGLPNPARSEQVAERLLRHLRDTYGTPELRYMERPHPIAIGVETWIYGLELARAPEELTGPLVVRIFPARVDAVQARFEYVIHNAIADLGYPAPRAPLVCPDPSVLGGPFLLMQRVSGRMMMDSLFAGGNVILRAPLLIHEALTLLPRTLADWQARLHDLDPAPVRAALDLAGIPPRLYTVDGWLDGIQEQIDRQHVDGFRATLEWLRAERPPDPIRPVLCHCDFLPPNIMMHRGRITGVIDWSHLTIADPAWDVANTRLRLAMNPFDGPGWIDRLGALLRPPLTRAYEKRYATHHTVDPAALHYYEVLLGMWLLLHVAEHRLGVTTQTEDGRGANPWLNDPRAVDALVQYCRRISGQPLTLPSGGGPA